MIKLYHNDMSVCAQKARFALAEKSHRLSLSETRHWHGRARKVSPEEDARPGEAGAQLGEHYPKAWNPATSPNR